MKEIVIKKNGDYWEVFIDSKAGIKSKSLLVLARLLYRFVKNKKGSENE